MERLEQTPAASLSASLVANVERMVPDRLHGQVALLAGTCAVALSGPQLAVTPETAAAQAQPGETCNTTTEQVPEGTKKTTTCVDANGNVISVTEETTGNTTTESEIEPPSEPTQPEETPKPPKKKKPARPSRQEPANPEENFQGYNMGASEFTDGNGCFVTATGSAFRRATGDADVTPRAVYVGNAIKKRWSPSTGVKQGNLFDALPQMAKHFGLKVKKVGARGLQEAVREGDEGMILFMPGHFAGGSGHYVAVRSVLPNGNLVLDDPNGKGKSGDSERKRGWSLRELKNKGAIKFRTIRPR